MQLKGQFEESMWSEMFKSEKKKGLKIDELSILLTVSKKQQNKPREDK